MILPTDLWNIPHLVIRKDILVYFLKGPVCSKGISSEKIEAGTKRKNGILQEKIPALGD